MRVTTTTGPRIAGYAARLSTVEVGDDAVPLWQVADLEAHVDRAALLGGVDPPEPPYWAHLWSGARVLAAAVPATRGRVVELGCGLGLPGLVAARRGAHVTFVDRERAPLAFVAASLAASGTTRAACVAGDFAALPLRGPFDLVLAAEILYDRATFGDVATMLAGSIGRRGRILLTDGQRIDTRAFYPCLEAAGLAWRAEAVRVVEEGFPVDVRLVQVWHP